MLTVSRHIHTYTMPNKYIMHSIRCQLHQIIKKKKTFSTEYEYVTC